MIRLIVEVRGGGVPVSGGRGIGAHAAMVAPTADNAQPSDRYLALPMSCTTYIVHDMNDALYVIEVEPEVRAWLQLLRVLAE
ncbi:hypothetical protein SSPO_075920 [Streptomyces antimycoticus]|uniref:Uncharacterized protein n=1 Tax=Streptomyces antimycoticus TaxID=68175 RepID=A0A499USF2_9ACTN|nr:hypothetical protein SSPO_075920 [Streptomyces antimycoticus]